MSTSYTAKGDENGNVLLPYKVCKALLTQDAKDDPVAVVLENTLGNVEWIYISIGNFIGRTNGLLNSRTIFTSSQTKTISNGDSISRVIFG